MGRAFFAIFLGPKFPGSPTDSVSLVGTSPDGLEPFGAKPKRTEDITP